EGGLLAGGCSGRGKGGHARRDGVSDAELIEPAQLLAKRAPYREVAGMQPRHVAALLGGAPALFDDLVQRQGRGVDDARARGAVLEQFLRHQRAGIEADRTATDQVAPAHGYQIDGARPGADEMHSHRPSPLAMAQVARSVAMRSPSSCALRPAATSAEASAIDGTPFASSTRLEGVRSRSAATAARSVAVQAT